MNQYSMTEAKKMRIAKDYARGKLLIREICEKHGVSAPTVIKYGRQFFPEAKKTRGGYYK